MHMHRHMHMHIHVPVQTKKRKRDQKKAKKKAGKWVATEEHANVYVQGLPEDTNVDEAHEFFKKVRRRMRAMACYFCLST